MACKVLMFFVALVSSAAAAPMLVEAPVEAQQPVYQYPQYQFTGRQDKPSLLAFQMAIPAVRLPKVPAVPQVMKHLGFDRLATGVRGFLDNLGSPSGATGRVPPYVKISDLPGTNDPSSSYVCGSNAEKGVMICVFPKKGEKDSVDEDSNSYEAQILPFPDSLSARRKDEKGDKKIMYTYPGMQPAYYIA